MSLYQTREQWGSSQTDPAGHPIGKVYEVIAHHFYKPHVGPGSTIDDERRTMQGVQRYHVVDQGWDDIGYQWVVFQSGRAYEGRGWFRTGAHTEGRNSKSVGICFAINGDDHKPTPEAWDTAREIVAEGIKVGAVDPDYKVSGHTDYAAKSCPGDLTYPLISQLEGATVGKKYAQAVVAFSDTDVEHGRVLAQTYQLALCQIGTDARLWSLTDPGSEARVDYAFLIGQAVTRAGHLPFVDGSVKLAGSDRDGTARQVGEFIESHPKDTMQRRGRPW